MNVSNMDITKLEEHTFLRYCKLALEQELATKLSHLSLLDIALAQGFIYNKNKEVVKVLAPKQIYSLHTNLGLPHLYFTLDSVASLDLAELTKQLELLGQPLYIALEALLDWQQILDNIINLLSLDGYHIEDLEDFSLIHLKEELTKFLC